MRTNYSCLDCIWSDSQCRKKNICEYFDNGQDETALSDTEIEEYHNKMKEKYYREYNQYLHEFENG